MEGDEVALACLISRILFAILGLVSFSILWAVNWHPWRIYSGTYQEEATEMRRTELDLNLEPIYSCHLGCFAA
ncbi:hypothetical protein ERO13_D04G087900v2 [Gossypium hirsutum]|uniref:Ig-like domain-containing protein n=2 Tax=Gossypium TaxID=3633 RepID=A0A5J5RU67_GOSBA|nr:hypothetical protein ES319_D04G098400v1 [Gossypium barbadense]KAG4151779.1 hypothetical protein ERO13_D04G087900v2 [Gossypium hirsutum]TYG73483.1 hypothetical protein ES288_D04G104800v1 [Gossypium darwinii]